MIGKVRMGVDPGKNGFITAIINDKELVFHSIPLIKKVYDLNELDYIFKTYAELQDVHCVLEDQHAKFGASAKSTFTTGYGYGVMTSLIIAHKIPYTTVNPKIWQKEIWQGVPVQKKPSSTGKTMVNDTKATSLIAVKRLFPSVDLKANNRCKIPHDGKVDSLLMAEYCRRKF